MNKFALLFAATMSASASAGVYESVFTLNAPYTVSSPNMTQVVLRWSTTASSGTVDVTQLSDWTMTYRSDSQDVFTDHILIAGQATTLGGVSRSVSDLRFSFDFATQSYSVFDSMYSGALLTAANSTVYNVYLYNNYPGEPNDLLSIWSNGNEATRQNLGYSSHVFSVVPAPSVSGLLIMGLGARWRRRN